MVRACEVDEEEKADEVTVVVEADTVIDPWTMMVHSKHAFLALTAMMRTWRLVGVAHSTMSWSARETLDFVSFICL